MGGKKYPKKGSGSESSEKTEAPPAGSSSSSQPQQPSVRQRLQQMVISAEQPSTSQPSQSSTQQHQSTGLSRAESTQSIASQSSQGAQKQEKTSQPIKQVDGLLIPYKGPGKKGSKLTGLQTNYLKLSINNMVDIAYLYDVKIVPDRPKRLLTMVFLRFVEINYPKVSIAFDGIKNAYASSKLKIGIKDQREIKIIHPETGTERTFNVIIQEAKDSEIPLKQALSTYQKTRHKDDPKCSLQALEIILKSAFHQPHLSRGIQGGRSYFLPPNGDRKYLGDFYELWLGIFQSTVLGYMPLLNVDVNHKAFPKRYSSLIELLKDMGRDMNKTIDLNRSLDRFVETNLRNHLTGLEICYNSPGGKRIYKFMRMESNPQNITFTHEGQQTTILQYFERSGRPIQYPALPCIKIGNSIKNQTVPMEFCSIPDAQVINKKCTENQTRNLIRNAATTTDVRKQKIMDLIKQIRHNQSSTIRGFGLKVDEEDFIKVPARQLEPPKIQYANRTIEASRGVWRAENIQFLVPKSAHQWGILNANGRTKQNELNDLATMLHRYSRSTGMQLADRPTYTNSVGDCDIQRVRDELEKIGKQKSIDILFCIIPDNGPTYAKIKRMAEIDFGVLTQCIKGGTVFRKRNDGSTIANILLKVNAKLNGTNHKLQSSPILSPKKVMVIGADVTHPSPDQKKIPSVVGVAASYDDHAFRYNICWRLQGQRKEMIEDFKTIMKEHLIFFKKENGVLPEKILYFRDGVSEGQFDQVMGMERNDMLQACREVQHGYEKKVKMTILVVQKRHHTRFFPEQTNIAKGDKNNNVPAGTIVDTHIIRPNENYFYLVSHQSIQGVAKPTKYCILLDEGNHSIDDLQALTYNLCHLFTRCNRAVSYPAPTYYAHLAAYRGRIYIENETLNMDNLEREYTRRAIKDNIIKGHPMYFV